MASSRSPGPLGLNPEVQDLNDGTMIRGLSPRPGPIGEGLGATRTSMEATQAQTLGIDRLLQRLREVSNGIDLQSVAVALLGPQCFSAGVIAGIGVDIIGRAADLLKLVGTLVLADTSRCPNRSSEVPPKPAPAESQPARKALRPEPRSVPPTPKQRVPSKTTTMKPTGNLAVFDQRPRDARGTPNADYKGRDYSAEQKDRIHVLGNDPKRGLRLEEGEAGLAAERKYNLKFTRYKQEGLEFKEQSGDYWDVVSPVSNAKNGRHVFRASDAIDSVKDHCLKGNVIVDYGRMNDADAQVMREAVEAMSDADKRGRKIVFVRNGE